jgi:CRP/FNR family transcriptional regulator, cyclic AMP receptor protein
MNLPEIVGYIAAGLVLATFSMRTMIPLRLLGISSNVAFIAYGLMASLAPVVALHAILLPLNIYRFVEMRRLVQVIKDAGAGAGGMAALLPYMAPLSLPAGATLFAKGEQADAMYLLVEGRIHLPEFEVDIEAGEMVGEIGLFSPEGVRMATATCVEDCRLQSITRERVRELVFQNPRFAFYLIGVVSSRLTEDLKIIELRVSHKLG